MCVNHTQCSNANGSHLCDCIPGFSGDGFIECSSKIDNSCLCVNINLPIFVVDVNECEISADNCDTNAACEDLFGSFMCTCNSGYSGSGTHCSAFSA